MLARNGEQEQPIEDVFNPEEQACLTECQMKNAQKSPKSVKNYLPKRDKNKACEKTATSLFINGFLQNLFFMQENFYHLV